MVAVKDSCPERERFVASNAILLGILLLGMFGRSNVVAMAAGILLVVKFARLDHYLPLLERRGLELGLLFLMLSVLVPFANGKVSSKEIVRSVISLSGIIAIVSGTLATHMNGKGLDLLQLDPSLMVGLVVGSMVGIIFFGGVPVGPLMAGGIAALFLSIIQYFKC
ncbi:MAG: DUF441 domain-containing protein [Clostridia bacterium]|nr:DUF441 domain-containing protein [Clostridia bacterium]